MFVAFLGAAWAACTFDQPVSALVDAMERAEASYADVDVPAFQQATVEVDYLVPCLDAPLPPDEVARLHRLRGIGYHTSKRSQDVVAAFRAARAAAPSFVPSTELFPEGFVLRDRYLAQPSETTLGRRQPRPAGGELVVNGAVAKALPTDAAALVQVVVDGAVQSSSYVLPGEPLPAYRGSTAHRDRWILAGGATLLAGGVLYGLASATSAARFDATDAEALAATQRRTNLLVGCSAIVAVGSAVPFGLAWRAGRR